MTKIQAVLPALAWLVMVTVSTAVSADSNSPMAGEQVDRQVVSCGGTDGDSPGHILIGTAGQSAVTAGSSANYIMHSGFWSDHAADISSCCLSPTVGDMDQSGGVDITDVSVLVDNQFLTLTPLVCEDEGNINYPGSGHESVDLVVDITDLSLLIDNQFLTLTPLPPCP